MGRKPKVRRLVSVEHSFEFYNMWKYKTNEYFFHLPDKMKLETRAINTIVLEELHVEVIPFPNTNYGCTVVKPEAIQRFHPNVIDNKKFWQLALDSFPLLSICGNPSKNIKDANIKTLQFAKNVKVFPFLVDLLDKHCSIVDAERLSVLEIGFGYGNVFFEIKDKCDYIGIDYHIAKSLKKYKNFIEINESGIPEYLTSEKYFDVIYCVNVLQHCSQKDRINYFRQGYQALKPGGYFIFTMFLMDKDNVNQPCWGIKDTNGRGYTHFFNQLTEVDFHNELQSYLHDIGYIPVHGEMLSNNLSMIVQKPK